METTTQFIPGKSYPVRSVGDWNCVWTFTVVSRTAKFITITETNDSTPKRVGVKVSNDAEWAEPLGRYSMAPTIRADRETV